MDRLLMLLAVGLFTDTVILALVLAAMLYLIVQAYSLTNMVEKRYRDQLDKLTQFLNEQPKVSPLRNQSSGSGSDESQ